MSHRDRDKAPVVGRRSPSVAHQKPHDCQRGHPFPYVRAEPDMVETYYHLRPKHVGGGWPLGPIGEH
jgi:hypothetical protein